MKKDTGAAAKRSERLARAGSGVLVQFTRPFEDGSVTGYALAVGPSFFLLALVDDNIKFNGFQCFRLKDIRNLEVPAIRSAFFEDALRLRKEKRPRVPAVVVDSLEELLRTAGRAFPVITIRREIVAPDVCHIGRVVAVSASHMALLDVGPDAHWDHNATIYRTKEITRVDFGGGYEDALVLVNGFYGNRRKSARANP